MRCLMGELSPHYAQRPSWDQYAVYMEAWKRWKFRGWLAAICSRQGMQPDRRRSNSMAFIACRRNDCVWRAAHFCLCLRSSAERTCCHSSIHLAKYPLSKLRRALTVSRSWNSVRSVIELKVAAPSGLNQCNVLGNWIRALLYYRERDELLLVSCVKAKCLIALRTINA